MIPYLRNTELRKNRYEFIQSALPEADRIFGIKQYSECEYIC